MKILAILAMGLSIFGGRWDGQSRFTVISVNDGVQVASFDPGTAEGIKLIFPPNWMIAGSDGRGEWLADKAARADLVAENLGILYTTSQSDMSWGDRLLWWWGGRKVKWREVDATRWMKKERTVDGVEVAKLDETWNAAARQMLASSAVLAERLMVTVVNTTGEPGLAARMARIVESAGMRVVAVETREEARRGCEVRSSKQSKSKTGVKLLVRLLGCEWREAGVGESEVELFLGQR